MWASQVEESDLPQIGPDRLIDAFPEHAFAIRRRLAIDPRFRAICDDYLDAVQALQHWEASCEPQSAARQTEYRQLIDNLLLEIAAALGEPPGGANT